ncbi:MAG: site-2 protease family protein [Phycisphaerae bacterium]|nr:site-2 protease family protein [Phycisphaerae bacterium]
MSTLADAGYLAIMIAGFTLVIVVHELGHLIAARWAGIRVLAFAVGFGRALFSYRPGLGWRRGSSDAEFQSLQRDDPATASRVSPTEYRWNILPLGGYVKMLGQEDGDPSARSEAPDSFQSCPPWKRLVVMSAGVAFNVILAAVLFIVVFSAGMRAEPARIGFVEPNSPAAAATPVHASSAGASGLRPGDTVTAIDGVRPDSFYDLVLATVIGRPGREIEITVVREGVPDPLSFRITPKESPETRIQSIGVYPASSGVLAPRSPELLDRLARAGLAAVPPDSALAAVNGVSTTSFYALDAAARASRGRPLHIDFRTPNGSTIPATINPTAELQTGAVTLSPGVRAPIRHLLGFAPVLRVEHATERAAALGLRDGDVFARVGDIEWPSFAQGIAEIRRNKDKSIPIVVVRSTAEGNLDHATRIDLGALPVSSAGTIGFSAGDSAGSAMLLAAPESPAPAGESERSSRYSTASLGLPPGTRILRVNGATVHDFASFREALRTAFTPVVPEARSHAVTLTVLPPHENAQPFEIVWNVPRREIDAVAALGWLNPLAEDLFVPDQIVLRAKDPLGALTMGLRETHRVMLTTYLTFVRLFQGSVKVEHLQGPVGIAHAGTIVASQGLIKFLFFLALISINLAVVNFLPLPVLDGGHVCFLLYEQITGRPVSVGVQNVATIAALLLIGSVFLLTTFNDIARLFGR